MKTAIIVQARMESQRLAGKVLKPVLSKPLLGHMIERLRMVRNCQQILIATTDRAEDKAIVEYARQYDMDVFRGSDSHVLERYYEAAKAHSADIVVRVTADCPLIDPSVVDLVIETFLQDAAGYDYVSNTLKRTYPRGMDTEVFSYEALEKAYHAAKSEQEKSHVTLHFYENPDVFSLGSVEHTQDLSSHRWTVDMREDFDLVCRLLEGLEEEGKGSDYSMQALLTLLESHPEWQNLNRHIEQKPL